MPVGFDVGGKSNLPHALLLIKNIYEGKASGQIWTNHLKKGLLSIDFMQSCVDPCVFYRGTSIFLKYVNGALCLSPKSAEVDKFIQDLQDANFKVTDEGDINDYLGVKVTKRTDGRFDLTQHHLIQQILDDLGFTKTTVEKSSPAPSTKLLSRDLKGPPFNENWDYRAIISKMNFLKKSTRLYTGYATQQRARLSRNHKESHPKAVKNIG